MLNFQVTKSSCLWGKDVRLKDVLLKEVLHFRTRVSIPKEQVLILET